MQKPSPKDESVTLDKYKYIMSRTDARGIIEYGNDYFFEISGYTKEELLGQPHSIIRHPDTPGVIFKMMWERLQSGKSIFALVKNLAKDGRYYWVTTKFEIQRDPISKAISGFHAYRQAANPKAVKQIEPLYAKLLEIEKIEGLEASERYLDWFLTKRETGYDTYIEEIIEHSGAVANFFSSMRKLFAS
jgi:PAS domain S-box-containing protein